MTIIYSPYDLEYIGNDKEPETVICADTNFGYVTKVLPKTKIIKVIVTKMADFLPW
jgi:long-chain acyl-CoA synthetase